MQICVALLYKPSLLLRKQPLPFFPHSLFFHQVLVILSFFQHICVLYPPFLDFLSFSWSLFSLSHFPISRHISFFLVIQPPLLLYYFPPSHLLSLEYLISPPFPSSPFQCSFSPIPPPLFCRHVIPSLPTPYNLLPSFFSPLRFFGLWQLLAADL